MRNIQNVTRKQLKKLFELADMSDFKITKTEYDKEDKSITVFAESEWNDGENDYINEDPIVTIYPTYYTCQCDFSPGFSLSLAVYIQWSLWCGFIEPIEFE